MGIHFPSNDHLLGKNCCLSSDVRDSIALRESATFTAKSHEALFLEGTQAFTVFHILTRKVFLSLMVAQGVHMAWWRPGQGSGFVSHSGIYWWRSKRSHLLVDLDPLLFLKYISFSHWAFLPWWTDACIITPSCCLAFTPYFLVYIFNLSELFWVSPG